MLGEQPGPWQVPFLRPWLTSTYLAGHRWPICQAAAGVPPVFPGYLCWGSWLLSYLVTPSLFVM